MSTAHHTPVTRLEQAYEHFVLDRQALPVPPSTLRLYGWTIGRFLRWVSADHPEVSLALTALTAPQKSRRS